MEADEQGFPRALPGAKPATGGQPPAGRNGNNQRNSTNPRYSHRNITWKHYHGVEDSYSRIDYLVLNPGIAHEWNTDQTYIPTLAKWGIGSDRWFLVATFTTDEECRTGTLKGKRPTLIPLDKPDRTT